MELEELEFWKDKSRKLIDPELFSAKAESLEKSENTIDRIRGTVAAAGPRFIERVPEGTKFRFLLTFKILQEGDEKLFDEVLLKGLKLLEMDALGGNGSRGYGRIAFEFNDKAIDDKFRALNPFQTL